MFASPEFLANTGTPDSPYDLFNRQGLKVGWQPSSEHWALRDRDGIQTLVPFRPLLCSDDMGMLKKAATEGLGVVSLPAYVCRDELNNGSLVKVLPNWTSGHAKISLLTPSRRTQSPAVRALSQYMVDHLHVLIGD